jgi:hypothetical protein
MPGNHWVNPAAGILAIGARLAQNTASLGADHAYSYLRLTKDQIKTIVQRFELKNDNFDNQ